MQLCSKKVCLLLLSLLVTIVGSNPADASTADCESRFDGNFSGKVEFEKAIRANLDQNEPRLVYADLLDEVGHHDLADLIRVQIELAQGNPDLSEEYVQHLNETQVALTSRLQSGITLNGYWNRGFWMAKPLQLPAQLSEIENFANKIRRELTKPEMALYRIEFPKMRVDADQALLYALAGHFAKESIDADADPRYFEAFTQLLNDYSSSRRGFSRARRSQFLEVLDHLHLASTEPLGNYRVPLIENAIQILDNFTPGTYETGVDRTNISVDNLRDHLFSLLDFNEFEWFGEYSAGNIGIINNLNALVQSSQLVDKDVEIQAFLRRHYVQGQLIPYRRNDTIDFADFLEDFDKEVPEKLVKTPGAMAYKKFATTIIQELAHSAHSNSVFDLLDKYYPIQALPTNDGNRIFFESQLASALRDHRVATVDSRPSKSFRKIIDDFVVRSNFEVHHLSPELLKEVAFIGNVCFSHYGHFAELSVHSDSVYIKAILLAGYFLPVNAHEIFNEKSDEFGIWMESIDTASHLASLMQFRDKLEDKEDLLANIILDAVAFHAENEKNHDMRNLSLKYLLRISLQENIAKAALRGIAKRLMKDLTIRNSIPAVILDSIKMYLGE